MVQRVQAKTDAKAQLSGYWGRAVGAFLLASLVMMAGSVISMIPFVGWIGTTILSGVMALGMAVFSLKFTSQQKPDVGDIFKGFENFLKAWGLSIVIGIFTALWSLLLIIPGIIKAISYSMAMYVLAENPEMRVMEALEKSKQITKGHKWELFVVSLSFIGWGLLVPFTLGIGSLWLVPYMNITMANVYNQIKGQATTIEPQAATHVENNLM
ncbi:hypothetical protein CS063_16875 [Sporanaerobium hydrogeniformans]|uniref:Uncharacterized protein n=1 Tax=Sporanaerobium hydrogeniformans TaxID=3072179 RepID=A0AC61D7D8_9FIRM|nr:DUF975 family protein [Sporanaerobium hydrogeniformans]PHV69237.1 hypothetical protein CS063_16875 [Sporanaerobium hydrogeniformans]